MVRNILDLGISAAQPAGSVIKPFFLQIQQKDKLNELNVEVGNFAQKIIARAIEKRSEQPETEVIEEGQEAETESAPQTQKPPTSEMPQQQPKAPGPFAGPTCSDELD